MDYKDGKADVEEILHELIGAGYDIGLDTGNFEATIPSRQV